MVAVFFSELWTAQSYIFMEYFILGSGLLWNSVMEILIEKASNGIEVRIIYDDIGCFLTLPSNFAKQLEQHGIKCVRACIYADTQSGKRLCVHYNTSSDY